MVVTRLLRLDKTQKSSFCLSISFHFFVFSNCCVFFRHNAQVKPLESRYWTNSFNDAFKIGCTLNLVEFSVVSSFSFRVLLSCHSIFLCLSFRLVPFWFLYVPDIKQELCHLFIHYMLHQFLLAKPNSKSKNNMQMMLAILFQIAPSTRQYIFIDRTFNVNMNVCEKHFVYCRKTAIKQIRCVPTNRFS